MQPVLHVEGLSVSFVGRHEPVHAVRDASFDVEPGQIVGLVGESGSGKTVTGLTIMGLIDRAQARVAGVLEFAGRDLLTATEDELRRVRGGQIGMVFQEPMTALNPLLTIGRQVHETLRAHTDLDRAAAKERAIGVLASVGMPEPATRYDAYPHQLSGGLRQRAMIAAAIACRPRLLIADEPTTALDVTIQAQILRLLRSLSVAEGIGILLITHDLGVVAQTCDRVVTMYAGEVVETGPVAEVLDHPAHPYTARLLAARPSLDGWGRKLESIPGRVPAADTIPTGCLFAERCPHTIDRCADPQVLEVVPDRPQAARCCRAVELLGVL